MTSCGKKTKIPDDRFASSEDLNKIPCVASDRYLKKVPEYVEVLNVCQDESNPSIVYMIFKLNGVFDYMPTCEIHRVDTDESFKTNKTTAPIVLNYHRSKPKTIPLNTNCKTKTFTLAFDFGVVIPRFLAAKTILFTLRMDGKLPAKLKIPDFEVLKKTVRHEFKWDKGPTPNPYRLVYNEDLSKLSIYFQFEQGIPCNCNILCKSISGNPNVVQYCEDKISRVVVDYTAGDDPSAFLIQFSDGFGNTSNLDFGPLIDTVPLSPTVLSLAKPRRVEIGISRVSIGGTELDEGIAYQIWKYDQTVSTASVWKGWSFRSYSTFTDTDIIPGRLYGYSVRYRGKFGEDSKLSSWVTVVA